MVEVLPRLLRRAPVSSGPPRGRLRGRRLPPFVQGGNPIEGRQAAQAREGPLRGARPQAPRRLPGRRHTGRLPRAALSGRRGPGAGLGGQDGRVLPQDGILRLPRDLLPRLRAPRGSPHPGGRPRVLRLLLLRPRGRAARRGSRRGHNVKPARRPARLVGDLRLQRGPAPAHRHGDMDGRLGPARARSRGGPRRHPGIPGARPRPGPIGGRRARGGLPRLPQEVGGPWASASA